MSEKTSNFRGHRGPAHGPMRGGMVQHATDFKGSMKKLIRFMKPYYALILISLILAGGASVCNIVAPSRLRDLTNEIMNASFMGLRIDMQKIASIGFVLIALYLGNAGLNYIQSFMMAGITQGLSKRFRTSISKKINVVPLGYFDSRPYGDTLSRVTNDVDTIGMTLNHSMASLLQYSVLLIGTMIAMFITKWQLALVAIITVPLGGIFAMAIIKKSQPLFSK